MELNLEQCKLVLSASELRTYSDCARKRYYSSRSLLSLATNKVNPSLVLGDTFHKALAYYYEEFNKLLDKEYDGDVQKIQDANFFDLEDLLNTIAVYEYNNEKLTPDDIKTLNCMIENYKQFIIEDMQKYSFVASEQPFTMNDWPVAGCMYHGFIDLVVKDRLTEKIYFFEHKTCKAFRPEIYDRFDIQLHIYDAYGANFYNDNFGGIILNQVKKAKTALGFDIKRNVYEYSTKEREDFFNWIAQKTIGLMNNEIHEPCNNYMTCKMCPYSEICLEYGYELPTSADEILSNEDFKDEEGNDLYFVSQREETGAEEE